ncbi:MAG: hypothetical protein CFE23_12175 [Flavobacterium sp. BFFFF1]|uniref:lipid A deacylase LpxR family protein n=1 Tax=Flavobacterium sp. BFFFF1 TaxID=2015557 RepID=UPI000BC6F061|nr:lipid A deacylase LpxR family protein [Flavobacterium sp. BFFFF1]OYU79875.1 MAG: hypothetical protein CFE23_12175 [Flavobacterium sp. BFFFF1]
MRNPFLFLIFFAIIGVGQTRPAEIGLVLDNDLYVSTVSDRYYTNGFEIFYKYLNKTQPEMVAKRISEFRLGQYIYNPYNIVASDIARNDRPFAGYLFGSFGVHTFYKNESVLKLDFQAGYVGPNAFGREMQEFFHNSFGYIAVQGWELQIKNALALQVNATYSHKIANAISSSFNDFHASAEVKAGTVNTNISLGLTSRLSLKPLLPIYDSNLYHAALNNDKSVFKNQSEYFLFLSPHVQYQLYDATIQGSLFNDNSPVTYAVQPFRFNAEAGLKYRKGKWDLSYVFVYRGKEVMRDGVKGFIYGSITLGYFL